MNNKTTNRSHLSQQDIEKLELLQKVHEKRGKQLTVDMFTGDLKEIDEIRQLIGREMESPEEKYSIYYKGIRNILMKYLPEGDGRQLIYDEKNIFLNLGKKKSDNFGVRGSDGRMTYQPVMGEMLDIIVRWVSESQSPMELYDELYELNEQHGYGHENYDTTTQNIHKARLNKDRD